MSNDQFDKLANRLDRLDDRLNKQNERFDQLDGGFLKLYRHMEEGFAKLHAELETKADRDQMTQLLNAIDGIAERLDTEEIERAATISQLDRHEKWIERASTQLKIKYHHGG